MFDSRRHKKQTHIRESGKSIYFVLVSLTGAIQCERSNSKNTSAVSVKKNNDYLY